MTQDVAIAHKDYDVAGGGEILAERLGLCFDAPVFAGFVTDSNRADLRADVRDLFGDRPVAGPLIKRGGVTRQLMYQMLWKRADELHDYDVVIQSGMEPLWYQPPDTQTTVAYLHSTPRVQYDLYPYLHDQPSSVREWLGSAVAEVYNQRVRHDMLPPTNYPDLWVCNSDLVERRVQRYYDVDPADTRVVYPPVPTDDLGPEHQGPAYSDAYVSINRLDDWKRIDEIVDAFEQLDERLVIAGKGPAEEELRERASDVDNIGFLGFVSEEEKRSLLASAKGVVYNPLNEDFGMVPIEAIASGTPVISVRDGFQQFQLTDGENAVLFDRDINNREATVRNLRTAVREFEADGVRASPEELTEWAEQFSISRFEREMRAAVQAACDRTAVETSIEPVPNIELEEGEEIAVADGGAADE